MTLGSFLVLLAVFVALAIAIVFICNNGGWQGGRGREGPPRCHPYGQRPDDTAAPMPAAKTRTTPTPGSTDRPGRKKPPPGEPQLRKLRKRRAGFLCLQPRASAVTSARMARIWSGSVPVSCQV